VSDEFQIDFIKNNTDLTFNLYKTLFEQIHTAALISKIDGTILEANMKSCDLFGYSWHEITNSSLMTLFNKSINWSEIITELKSKGSNNFETENTRKDCTLFPSEVKISLFGQDDNYFMMVLINDLTHQKKSEYKLQLTDEKYRTIFENSAVAIRLTDENEKIVSWNKYSEEMLDMTYDDLYMKPVESLYPIDEWRKIRAENIREKGMQHHLETKIIKKNNQLLDIDISVSIIKDQDGKTKGSIGIIRDITDRKKTENKLLESEKKYSALFECTTDTTFVLDARGEILDINDQGERLFGRKKDALIGENFLSMNIFPQKSVSIIIDQFEKLLLDKISMSQETEIIDHDGNILYVEISTFFLCKKEGEIDNFVIVIRDISNRKQTEMHLAREHELLQTLMDNIPDSIYFKDEKNKFIYVNKAKAMHSNVNSADMIGKTDFDFLPDEQARKSFDDDEEILKTGKYIINKVEKLTGYEGSERWVSVTKVPRFDNQGSIVGTVGISRDITEWKRLEEQVKNMS